MLQGKWIISLMVPITLFKAVTQTQRLESPVVTLTWHASIKYIKYIKCTRDTFSMFTYILKRQRRLLSELTRGFEPSHPCMPCYLGLAVFLWIKEDFSVCVSAIPWHSTGWVYWDETWGYCEDSLCKRTRIFVVFWSGGGAISHRPALRVAAGWGRRQTPPLGSHIWLWQAIR